MSERDGRWQTPLKLNGGPEAKFVFDITNCSGGVPNERQCSSLLQELGRSRYLKGFDREADTVRVRVEVRTGLGQSKIPSSSPRVGQCFLTSSHSICHAYAAFVGVF